MAIKNISTESESSTGLEFINDWLESKHAKEKQVLNGQAFVVKSISASESGKGFTCITPSFMVFFWKKSPEGQMIQEWLTTSEGYQPVIVIDLDRKSKCLLAEDDEKTVFFEQGARGSNRFKIYDDPKSNYQGRTSETVQSSDTTETTTPTPVARKHAK
jgi:hypothetical protein